MFKLRIADWVPETSSDESAPVVVLFGKEPDGFINKYLKKYQVFRTWDKSVIDKVFVKRGVYKPFVIIDEDVSYKRTKSLKDRFGFPTYTYSDFARLADENPDFDILDESHDSTHNLISNTWMKEGIKPRDKRELESVVNTVLMEQNNPSIDLNFIDISNVDTLSFLFKDKDFNGDISKWDTSKIRNMREIFSGSTFNGDISNWNTSKVEDMWGMFMDCPFNGDISRWDTSRVKDMGNMFARSGFRGTLDNFDTSRVTNMSGMFEGCSFNNSLEKFDVSSLKSASSMFEESKFNKDLSKWELPKSCETSLMFYDSPLESKYGVNAEKLKGGHKSARVSSIRNRVISFEHVPDEYTEDVRTIMDSFRYDDDWDVLVNEVMQSGKPYGVTVYIAEVEQMDRIVDKKGDADCLLVSIAYDPQVSRRYRVTEIKKGKGVKSYSFADFKGLLRQIDTLLFDME